MALTSEVETSSALISIYFDLASDSRADIEVVARMSVALSSLLRDISFALDPSLQPRLELIDGTQSSLWLNAQLRSLRLNDLITRKRLIAVAAAAGCFIAVEIRDWIIGKGIDAISELVTSHLPLHQEQLSDADVERIAREVVQLNHQGIGRPQVGQIFREAERDPAIQGLGLSPTPVIRPRIIVPRTDFQHRWRAASNEPILPIERTETTERDLVIVSPVLVEEPRQWRFRDARRQFGATMADKDFLLALLNGGIDIPMKVGVHLHVLLTTTEEYRDHVWTVTKRVVDRVYGFREGNQQLDLFATQDNEDDIPE